MVTGWKSNSSRYLHLKKDLYFQVISFAYMPTSVKVDITQNIAHMPTSVKVDITRNIAESIKKFQCLDCARKVYS